MEPENTSEEKFSTDNILLNAMPPVLPHRADNSSSRESTGEIDVAIEAFPTQTTRQTASQRIDKSEYVTFGSEIEKRLLEVLLAKESETIMIGNHEIKSLLMALKDYLGRDNPKNKALQKRPSKIHMLIAEVLQGTIIFFQDYLREKYDFNQNKSKAAWNYHLSNQSIIADLESILLTIKILALDCMNSDKETTS